MMTQKGTQVVKKEDESPCTSSRCRRHDDSRAGNTVRPILRSPTRYSVEKHPKVLPSSYPSSSKSAALPDRARSPARASPLTTSPPTRARSPPLAQQSSLTTRRQPSPARKPEEKDVARINNSPSMIPTRAHSTVLIARQTLPNPYLRWFLSDHRYLGPVAPPLGTPPADEDDAIARDQVLAYLSARCERDIRLADRTALARFAKNSLAALNWHSAVLLVHLAFKYFLESIFGVKFLAPAKGNGCREIALRKNTSSAQERNTISANTTKVSGSTLPPALLLTSIPSLAGPSRSYTVNPHYILMRLEKQMTVMGERMSRLERAVTRSHSPSR